MITSRPDAHCEVADIEQMLLQGEIPGDSGRSWLCAACGKDTNLWWAMVVCTWHMEIPPAWDSYPVQPFPSQWSVWPTNHCDGTSLLILTDFCASSLSPSDRLPWEKPVALWRGPCGEEPRLLAKVSKEWRLSSSRENKMPGPSWMQILQLHPVSDDRGLASIWMVT